jgi:hypothetical protein
MDEDLSGAQTCRREGAARLLQRVNGPLLR